MGRDKWSLASCIDAYVRCGKATPALKAFRSLKEEDSLRLSKQTFIGLLKACGKLKDINTAVKLHDHISRKGTFVKDSDVRAVLVDMFAKCGSIARAKAVLDDLRDPDVKSLNALIAVYVQHGAGRKALDCFELLQQKGVCPNAITFVHLLKACGIATVRDKGFNVHAIITTSKEFEQNSFICSALIDMYGKLGLLAKAQEVFNMLPKHDIVSWNTLISGYVHQNWYQNALDCLTQMQLEGISPNAITFSCLLKACGRAGNIGKGNEISEEILNQGLLGTNVFVSSGLIDMYGKFGLLAKAQEVFDMLPVRNIVSWNALLSGYAQHDFGEEVLEYFEQIQSNGLSPNAVTYTCCLKACGSIGNVEKGNEIHAEIVRNHLLSKNVFIASALVDMYAKSGALSKAHEVFDRLSVRNVVTWSALISGYAQVGQIEKAFSVFDKMTCDGNKPDRIAFVNMLNACNHAGIVEKAYTFFETMSEVYGILPSPSLHTCIVDLLGRAGQLDWAMVAINKAPFHPNNVMWVSVLGACRKWQNLELGMQAFDEAVEQDDKEDGAYVSMYNIYADLAEE